MRGKILNIVSSTFAVVMILCISYYTYLVSSIFNMVVLGVFMVIINPVLNLYCNKKRIIDNVIYHIILIIIFLYNIYIGLNSIIIYYQNYYIDWGNASQLYFFNHFPITILLFIILFFLSFIFKKRIIYQSKDNSKILFLTIAFLACLPMLENFFSISSVIGVALSIFSIIMAFNKRSLHTKSELQKLYFLLLVLSLLASNPISAVLIINLYMNLDQFGLNI